MELQKLYKKINSKLIELMEQQQDGHWIKPWITSDNNGLMPHNGYTNHLYKGINSLLLSISAIFNAYDSNRWFTFKQVKDFGGKIKKGSVAEQILFSSFFFYDEDGKKVSEEEAETKILKGKKVLKRFIVKYHNVFNIEQIENIPEEYLKKETDTNTSQNIKLNDFASDILNISGAKIIHKFQNIAYYDYASDVIALPDLAQFDNEVNYYSVAFHELGHWTGHKSRLNRESLYNNDKKSYAFEELIAELNSAYMCAYVNEKVLIGSTIDNSAKYLNSWIKLLKQDYTVFFRAAYKAQTASKYLLNFCTNDC